MMEEAKMYIGGEWVGAISAETFSDLNPATGEVFAQVPKGNEKDADGALQAAFEARNTWAGTPPGERAAILYKASELLGTRIEEFARVLINEGGATFGKAMFETTYTVDLLRTAGEDCRRLLGETFPSDHNKLSMTVYRPLGTVVAISPWNFPLLLSVNKVAYALAAGNTVVLKPSSETPVICLKIADLMAQAGLPPGVLNVLTGPGALLGDYLVQDDRTALVTLTGETKTGRHVAEKAAAKLKKYTLELGGKDPLVICEDANIDYAVDAAAFGAFMHQGQICMSVERLIVHEKLADEFAKRLAAKAETLPVGDPSKPETIIGPLINDQQIKTVHSHVTEAVADGAKILTGGTHEGRFYRPTVLTGITRQMRIFREETFGPTAPIIAFGTDEEALEIANDTEYGLSSGVITSDLQRALFFAENLESGMVHVNDASVHDEPFCPFGGCKQSGVGREGGRHSMEEMSEIKWVTIQRQQRHFPF
ncbi:MAG: aldehyde dehydrogenase family protein [Deltaproteobacteria bacterium]